MSQINIRINKQTDQLFQYLANKRKIAKATLVKELLLENLKEKILKQLLDEYEKGEIQLKTIGKLLEIPPHELFKIVSENHIEPPITDEIDEYTQQVTDKLIEKLKIEN
ncbi:MAG: hypothetical protein K9W44_13510 [Candidatus Lokiarchaeota archaeon]|nr:hypothetical protein [Candidatus Harpocratesius repetitus]